MHKGECPACGGHVEFPDDALAMTVNCPHCSRPMELVPVLEPASEQEQSSTREATDMSAIEWSAAFGDGAPRQSVSWAYSAGMLLTAMVMIVLPLLYVAVVGAAAYGVYWYATHCSGLLFARPMGGLYVMIARFLLYVAPLFAGAVMVFFMIKPLLARRGRSAVPLAMDPAANPKLFAFIATVCDRVGAPMPARISLVGNMNAAAGFRGGLFGMLRNDIELIVGIPLVAGLNTRQFAAVVAHEFGHFTQGSAMRVGLLVDSINGWFARVVYERDAWDEALDQWAAENEDGRVGLVIWTAQAGVWFSRLILKILMFTGHAASCFLSRQMEFHADRVAASIAGSQGLESLLIRTNELGAATQQAYLGMRELWRATGRLPESVPQYVMLLESRFTPETRERIHRQMINHSTGLFDTHPTDSHRIQRARQAQLPGVFDLEAPTAVLFGNFEAVGRMVTLQHYMDDIGIPVSAQQLRPVEEYAGEADKKWRQVMARRASMP